MEVMSISLLFKLFFKHAFGCYCLRNLVLKFLILNLILESINVRYTKIFPLF